MGSKYRTALVYERDRDVPALDKMLHRALGVAAESMGITRSQAVERALLAWLIDGGYLPRDAVHAVQCTSGI